MIAAYQHRFYYKTFRADYFMFPDWHGLSADQKKSIFGTLHCAGFLYALNLRKLGKEILLKNAFFSKFFNRLF